MNEGKSAASFGCQVAALVPDMFYLVKNHKTAHNTATTEAKEKIIIFGILRILEIF
jgi:hypothetical protein